MVLFGNIFALLVQNLFNREEVCFENNQKFFMQVKLIEFVLADTEWRENSAHTQKKTTTTGLIYVYDLSIIYKDNNNWTMCARCHRTLSLTHLVLCLSVSSSTAKKFHLFYDVDFDLLSHITYVWHYYAQSNACSHWMQIKFATSSMRCAHLSLFICKRHAVRTQQRRNARKTMCEIYELNLLFCRCTRNKSQIRIITWFEYNKRGYGCLLWLSGISTSACL